ncbi:MAG: M23 family metallopeptidase [Acidobacteria bacterium]|nr:M23 family metallopeptidase [Acidobacteriota bacterium]
MAYEKPRRRIPLRWPLLLIVVLALVYFVLGALRAAPPPAVTLDAARPAIGGATEVRAQFKEPRRGLAEVTLEIVQGDKSAVLAHETFAHGSLYPFRSRPVHPEAELKATVGRGAPDWLREGEAVLRATATRIAGTFRGPAPVVVEKKLPVRFRPPRLELLTSQHYVRQGGAGAVVFRAGDTAVRSGVRAGEREMLSYPLPGGGPGERFVLFGIPWDLSDPGKVRLFAEDDAGNRSELGFINIFKPRPPTSDTIEISDAFLDKVVPEIVGNTPDLKASGSTLEQYLEINGELRRRNLRFISELAGQSEPALLWSGAFLQMANSQRRAGFADTRDYRYQGRSVDRQTHLGLDLASLSRAPAPAPNAGVVLFAGYLGIYGNAVIIDHGYGLLSLQGHLSSVAVEKGARVTKGQTIGATGATGLAGGDHLHLEMFVQGISVDPVEWLDEHWIRDNIGTKLRLPA